MAKLVKVDGTITDAFPANGKEFTLQEMQKFVGGYIEIIRSNNPLFLVVVNEDGRPLGLPLNRNASSMCAENGMLGGDNIVGDVLVGCPEEFGFNQ